MLIKNLVNESALMNLRYKKNEKIARRYRGIAQLESVGIRIPAIDNTSCDSSKGAAMLTAVMQPVKIGSSLRRDKPACISTRGLACRLKRCTINNPGEPPDKNECGRLRGRIKVSSGSCPSATSTQATCGKYEHEP